MSLYLSQRHGERGRRTTRAVRFTQSGKAAPRGKAESDGKAAKSMKIAKFVRELPAPVTTVTVTVLGRAGQASVLRPHLPDNWAVRSVADVRAANDRDLLVLGSATGSNVALARRLHPYTVIVAVIDTAAPVDVIVDVLGAGADACVRSGSTAILAGHLRACQRRRQAGQISGVASRATMS
jgi:hypothetical protein